MGKMYWLCIAICLYQQLLGCEAAHNWQWSLAVSLKKIISHYYYNLSHPRPLGKDAIYGIVNKITKHVGTKAIQRAKMNIFTWNEVICSRSRRGQQYDIRMGLNSYTFFLGVTHHTLFFPQFFSLMVVWGLGFKFGFWGYGC